MQCESEIERIQSKGKGLKIKESYRLMGKGLGRRRGKMKKGDEESYGWLGPREQLLQIWALCSLLASLELGIYKGNVQREV